MNKKILIIRFGSLGDIILTSATILNIKCNYPDAHINFLTKVKFRPIVEMLDGVDEICTIQNNISSYSYYKFLNTIDSQYDIIFDLHGNFRSWMARKMITSGQVVVYPKRRIERNLIVKNKKLPEQFPHTIDLYNQTLHTLEKTPYHNRPVIKTENLLDDSVREFFKQEKHFVVVAPGASYKTKQYAPEKFATVALELNAKNNCAIIWADASIDDDLPKVLEKIPQTFFLRLSNYPIKQLASVIEKAQLTIANDSGVAHLSSAVNTPIIAIFGPTHPSLGFAPRGIHDQVIHVDEACRPCSLHGGKECFRDSQYCFDKILPERIVTLAQHKLTHSLMHKKAIFLDRDGTIIVEKDYLANPNDIEIIKGSIGALKNLQNSGYKLVVVSNQSGVARGKFGVEDVEKVNMRLSEMLMKNDIYIDAFYYCPHHPDGILEEFQEVCQCRKPAMGMVEEAIRQLEIDPRQSYMIGDKLSDLHVGKLMGGKSILVRTGYGASEEKLIDSSVYYKDIQVCDNLLLASQSILKN